MHRFYDSFGNVTSQVNPDSVDLLFGLTGRAHDEATGLQNNLNRWYDAAVGRWISEDPIGFAGGDANLVRYVGNGASNNLDSAGLQKKEDPNKKTYHWREKTDREGYYPVRIIVEVPIGGGEVVITAEFRYPKDSEYEYEQGCLHRPYCGDDEDGKKPDKDRNDKGLPILTWTVDIEDDEKSRIEIREPNRDKGLLVEVETDEFGNVESIECSVLNDPIHELK